MNAGKKMALVPVEMVENIMWNSALSALQNPNKDQLLKSTESVNKLNDNTDLPENIKVDRQAKNKKDASFMSSKLIPTLTRQDKKIDDDYQKHFENVSRTYQQSTKAILRELKHHSNCLQIDQQTNEVTIDGEKLVKSDLFYLILDVVRPSNALLPLHGECFLKFLADVNLPEQFIWNKYRIKHLRSYKSSGRSARSEEDVSQSDDDNMLEDFQRQWRIQNWNRLMPI